MVLATEAPAAIPDPSDQDPEDLQYKGHSVEQIKAAALNVLKTGHQRAAQNMSEEHQWMERFEQLFSGRWASDLTTESATLNQIYIPKLAEFIEFDVASEIQQFIPDPQTMDFVTVTSRWPGMEQDAKRGEAIFRQKLRSMKPPGSNSLYQSIYQLKIEQRVLGNMLGLVTHEVFAGNIDGDPQAPMSEGPSIERISPRNWFPWSLSVDNVRQCAHTIRSILSEDDAAKIWYLDLEELRERHKARELDRVQGGVAGDSTDATFSSTSASRGPGDTGWERMIYVGPLPWYAIAENLNETETWTREDVVLAMVFAFGQNIAEGADFKDGQWWIGEWIDSDYLFNFLPFAIELPDGCGPLFHEPFHKTNGRLLGQGVYHHMEWLERLYNEYNRLLLQLGRFAAEPPVVANPDLLDEDWLAEHEDQETFLQPGERIQLRRGTGALPPGTAEPFHVLEMGVGEAMNGIRVEMDRLEALMRSDSQTTSEYTGGSRARTATAAQNNLIQSRTMEGFHIKMGENGWLLDILQRCYVLMRQVIQMRGNMVNVTISDDERNLQLHAVDPSAIRDLTYYNIGVAGSSSPNNRIYLVQQYTQLLTVLIPIAGQVGADLRWFVMRILDQLQERNKESAFFSRTDLESQLANITALIGAGGAESLPPEIQQQIMALVQTTAPLVMEPEPEASSNPPSKKKTAKKGGSPPPKRIPGLANAPGLPSMSRHPSGNAVGMTGVQ